jgi:hypothetical protein
MNAEQDPIDPSQIKSGPIRNESLSPEVIEQMEAVYEVIGPYLGQTLEQLEVAIMRDSCPEDEAIIWVSITAAWDDYHEKYLHGEVLDDDEERKIVAALIAISTDQEDVTKLPVPVEVGTRLLECYDGLAED